MFPATLHDAHYNPSFQNPKSDNLGTLFRGLQIRKGLGLLTDKPAAFLFTIDQFVDWLSPTWGISTPTLD